MKKLLSVILAIAIMMTLSISAFATKAFDQDTDSDTTDVTLNITTAYTISIPATVEFAAGALSVQKAITATDVLLKNNFQITVAIDSENDFNLKTTENATLPYTVKTSNEEEAQAVADGATVATFTDDDTQALYFATSLPDVAGEYSDTVTFTVAVGAIPTES